MRKIRVSLLLKLMVILAVEPVAGVFAQEVQTVDIVVGNDTEAKREQPKEIQISDPATAIDQEPDAMPGLWNADPFALLDQMEQQMAAMHRQMDAMFAGGTGFTGNGQRASLFDTNFEGNSGYEYEETPDQIILTCFIPGVIQSSLDFQIQGQQVSLQGMSEQSQQESHNNQQSQYHFYSSSRSSFYKQFPLHPEANPTGYQVKTDPEKITVTFKRQKASKP